MNAEEIMKAMKEMNNAERFKLLDMLYKEYFDTGVSPEQLEREFRILEEYENDYEQQ